MQYILFQRSRAECVQRIVCTKYHKHFSRGQLTQTLFSCLLNEQNMQMHSSAGRNASFSLYVSDDTTNCKDIY